MRFFAWLFRPRCKHAWATVHPSAIGTHKVCVHCGRAGGGGPYIFIGS